MPIFVVHEHHAKHLHWDLRLEFNKVLKSWALPKIPPVKPGIKRLAIKVPNHALAYAKFRGKIKEGYGKGLVKIWDKGVFKTIKKKGGLVVELKGKKLRGKYVLFPFRKEKKQWLFFREKPKAFKARSK